MRWRRRFQVVVEGEAGAAISQRSVISEHRSERDAREAAAQERRRLEVIRAEEAADWVISVVRGDEVVHVERPFDGRRDAVPTPPLERPRIRQRPPEEDEAEGAGGDTGTFPAVDAPEAGGDTGTFPAVDAPEAAGDTGTFPAVGVPEDAPARNGATAPHDDAGDAPAPGTGPDDAPAETGAPADAHPEPVEAEPVGAETAESAGDEEAGTPEAGAPAGEAADADAPTPPETVAGEPAAPSAAAEAIGAPPVDEVDLEPVPEFGPGGDDEPPAADADDEGAARRPARSAGGDDPHSIPSGPVPEEVIRRFEEAIERERRRAARRRA